jgi:UDP-N-acetylglucosamine 2-epimerase (non-hydrolysing)
MKVAMVLNEMREYPQKFHPLLVHTGQHYDYALSGAFFRDLSLPEPDTYLGVGSANHGEQTGRIMIEFEKIVEKEKPSLIVVVGDVNSTLAAAVVASKLMVPLAHVEAGLRSFDRTMPEEINRVVTDILSDYCFTTEEDANINLRREGVDESKVFLVGDVMIDCLLKTREKLEDSRILRDLDVEAEAYALLTLHRPSNVDFKETLSRIFEALEVIGERIRVVFPAHPRTRNRLAEFRIAPRNVTLMEPLGYLDFLVLEEKAKFVLTDSGSMQQETTFFGVPCLTIRENTERPFTISKGTNTLVGSDPDKIIEESFRVMDGRTTKTEVHELWDGKASQRLVKVLKHAGLS